MEDLFKTIQQIKQFQREHNLKFSDDQILDTSGRIVNTSRINRQGKSFSNSNREAAKPPFFNSSANQTPATSDQIKYLTKFKIPFDPNSISKKTAWVLIKGHKEENNGKHN